ncbi:hypothetical protein BACOVA_02431 [Bacteroides ovatus ATCC 8483]|uniref:Uncharacterized protein n=1 Tax=Bacteroides ovatus (strain ATCC 8483 / DSM 1896 / JCM 5824 / BCRC 10623 / CCUG 4943 / NCTC 11153) TaxID=411476 RepID=A0AAN3D875_BACO1|nr:hypothetical protein BACOVA_02431 [Bacteroides ovatus ATCC 8483]
MNWNIKFLIYVMKHTFFLGIFANFAIVRIFAMCFS